MLLKDWQLCSATEFGGICIETFLNDQPGGLRILYIADQRLLALQRFVNRKEMPHFVKNVFGQLGNVLIPIIAWIFKRDRNDLFVQFAAVGHGDTSNRITAYQT